jgi:hypothetical protein
MGERVRVWVAGGLLACSMAAGARADPAAPGETASSSAGPSRRVQGLVAELDRVGGVLRLLVDGEVLVVRAQPEQLAMLAIAESVDVSLRDYGGAWWLQSRSAGPESLGYASRAAARSVRGEILAMDVAAGVVIVDQLALNAHPRLLAPLAIGESVALTYRDLDNRGWVQGIGAPAPASADPRAVVLNPSIEGQPRARPMQLVGPGAGSSQAVSGATRGGATNGAPTGGRATGAGAGTAAGSTTGGAGAATGTTATPPVTTPGPATGGAGGAMTPGAGTGGAGTGGAPEPEAE